MGSARGVEIRGNAIRVAFVYQGERLRKTLKVDGKALYPTPANIKYADRLLIEIKIKIRAGIFMMSEYFPDEAAAAQGNTVKDQLEHWLSVKRAETSTLSGYQSAIRYWNQHLGAISLNALRHSGILKAIKKRPDLRGKTINNYVSALRSALELAVIDKSHCR